MKKICSENEFENLKSIVEDRLMQDEVIREKLSAMSPMDLDFLMNHFVEQLLKDEKFFILFLKERFPKQNVSHE